MHACTGEIMTAVNELVDLLHQQDQLHRVIIQHAE